MNIELFGQALKLTTRGVTCSTDNLARTMRPLKVTMFLALALAFVNVSLSQPEKDNASTLIANGGMEDRTDDDLPDGWMFGKQQVDAGYRLSLDEANPFEGLVSARVDSTGVDEAASQFGNLSQTFDATPWRGKRVRFRAAVKTAERTANGRAQLWFRVDRKSSGAQPKMGFFDNMDNRPVVADAWQHYEIVGDIDEEAERIILGMLVLGKCIAWIDDASLEVVEKSVPVTGSSIGVSASDPPQPFFVWWLVLPVVALVLFWLGYAGERWINRFAFRFSVAYWVLYCFPTVLQTALSVFFPVRVMQSTTWYQNVVVDPFVRWTAANVLGIGSPLVSAFQNGSGDTTFSYVQANFCYDVPVKLYSFHLVVMALFICLPDFSRLANVLLWHRATETVSLLPPYAGRVSIWFQRAIKFYLIVVAIGLPVYMHVLGEWKSAGPFRVLGEWNVESVNVDGQPGTGELAGAIAGHTLTLARTFPPASDRSQIAASVLLWSEGEAAKTGTALIHADKLVVTGGDLAGFFPGESMLKSADGTLELTGQVEGKELKVLLKRASSEHLLMNRGFRWVNERPFNR